MVLSVTLYVTLVVVLLSYQRPVASTESFVSLFHSPVSIGDVNVTSCAMNRTAAYSTCKNALHGLSTKCSLSYSLSKTQNFKSFYQVDTHPLVVIRTVLLWFPTFASATGYNVYLVSSSLNLMNTYFYKSEDLRHSNDSVVRIYHYYGNYRITGIRIQRDGYIQLCQIQAFKSLLYTLKSNGSQKNQVIDKSPITTTTTTKDIPTTTLRHNGNTSQSVGGDSKNSSLTADKPINVTILMVIIVSVIGVLALAVTFGVLMRCYQTRLIKKAEKRFLNQQNSAQIFHGAINTNHSTVDSSEMTDYEYLDDVTGNQQLPYVNTNFTNRPLPPPIPMEDSLKKPKQLVVTQDPLYTGEYLQPLGATEVSINNGSSPNTNTAYLVAT